MIAKEVARRRGGGSFGGLVAYLTNHQGRAERIGQVRLSNCVSADPESAVLEVQNIQAVNHRAQDKTYHLILSFRAGQWPSREVLEAVEERACAALGFSEHQRISVVHRDTDHLHVHVAINRVHPTRYTVHSPSYSKLVLDRLCVELERDYGLAADHHLARDMQSSEALQTALQRRCPHALTGARTWAELHDVARDHGPSVHVRGNGLAIARADGIAIKASSVSRELSKVALEQQLGPFEACQSTKQELGAGEGRSPRPRPRRPPDMERIADMESLAGWVQRTCGKALVQAGSWTEVHEVAASHGLSLRPRGNGLVFASAEGLVVKASSVARQLSKAALERRLGPFVHAATSSQVVKARYARRPMARADTQRLYERYLQERAAYVERRAQAAAQLYGQRKRHANRQASARRWAAIRLVAKGQLGWTLWSAYGRAAERRDRRRAGQRRKAALLAASGPRVGGWLDWLRAGAAAGDAETLRVLRNRYRPESLGDNNVQSLRRGRAVTAAIDGVTARGTLVRCVPGGSVRDDGSRLYLCAPFCAEAAAETLVRLAYERYGPRLSIDGDEAFRASVVRAAAKTALPIVFAVEPLERRRQPPHRHARHRLALQRHRRVATEGRSIPSKGRRTS